MAPPLQPDEYHTFRRDQFCDWLSAREEQVRAGDERAAIVAALGLMVYFYRRWPYSDGRHNVPHYDEPDNIPPPLLGRIVDSLMSRINGAPALSIAVMWALAWICDGQLWRPKARESKQLMAVMADLNLIVSLRNFLSSTFALPTKAAGRRASKHR
jgi:hypothetical protein